MPNNARNATTMPPTPHLSRRIIANPLVPTEIEVQEIRERKQAEWEKVRTEDQPLGRYRRPLCVLSLYVDHVRSASLPQIGVSLAMSPHVGRLGDPIYSACLPVALQLATIPAYRPTSRVLSSLVSRYRITCLPRPLLDVVAGHHCGWWVMRCSINPLRVAWLGLAQSGQKRSTTTARCTNGCRNRRTRSRRSGTRSMPSVRIFLLYMLHVACCMVCVGCWVACVECCVLCVVSHDIVSSGPSVIWAVGDGVRCRAFPTTARPIPRAHL